LEQLGRCPKLCAIDLGASKYTPRGLAQLAGLASLEKLSLTGFATPLSDEALAALAELPALRQLELQFLSVSDAGMRQLARMTELAGLSLLAVDVTDTGIASLAPLVKLQRLEVVECPIHGTGLSCLEGMKGLTKVWVKTARVESTVEAQPGAR